MLSLFVIFDLAVILTFFDDVEVDVVIIAKDAWTAFEHCERLEHICQIVLASGK